MVDVASLKFSIDAREVDSGDKSLHGLAASAGAAEKSVLNLRNASMLLGSALAAAGITGGLSSIASNTREFGKAVSSLSAITGAVGPDLQFLADQARDIGRSTTLGASQAVEAFKLIASAKPDLLKSGEALNAVTREAVTLSEAAQIDLAEAANVLGTSLNQFQAGADQASRFINVLAAGAQLGASSIADTSGALKNVGAAAQAAGVDFEETNAAIQALAAGGLKASEAGTGLRNVILKLESSSNSALRPSIVGLTGALETLAKQNLSVTEIQKMFGMEGVVATSTLMAQIETVKDLNANLRGTSIAYEQAATNVDNLDGDIISLGNSMEGLTLTLGERANPALRESVQFFREIIVSLDEFVDSGVLERLGLEFEAVGEVIGGGTDLWQRDVGESLTVIGGMFFDFAGRLDLKSLDLMQSMTRTWSIGLINMRTMVAQFGVSVGSASDKLELWLNRGSMTALEWAERLRMLQGVNDAAMSSIQDEANTAFMELDALRDKLFENRQEFEGWSFAASSAAESAQEFADGIDAVSAGMLILKPELLANNRGAELFSVNIGAMNRVLETGEFRMKGVTKAVIQNKEAMEIHRVMIEGVQSEWADLIYNVLDDGELKFSSFFKSVASGFKRMIAEMAAADLAKAIFGGGGLGALTGGNIAGLLGGASGGIGSMIGTAAGGAGAGAAAGAGGALSGLMGSAGAFLTSPLGIGLAVLAGGAAIHNMTSDPDGYKRTMAGMLVAPTPGANRSGLFDVAAFESGFKPTGFSDAASRQEAEKIIAQFGSVDSLIAQAARAAGGSLNLSGSTLAGLDVDGILGTSGTFLGQTGRSSSIQDQANYYGLQIAKHIQGLTPDTMAKIVGASSVEELLRVLDDASKASETSAESSEDAAASSNAVAETNSTLDAVIRHLTSTNEILYSANGDLISSNGSVIASAEWLADTMKAMPGELAVAIRDFETRASNRAYLESLKSQASISASSSGGRLFDSMDVGVPFGVGRTLEEASRMGGQKAGTHYVDGVLYAINGKRVDGSHYNGIPYVPRDGWNSELHEGERVLTRSQNSNLAAIENGAEVFSRAVVVLEETLRLLNDWDRRGQPPTRA